MNSSSLHEFMNKYLDLLPPPLANIVLSHHVPQQCKQCKTCVLFLTVFENCLSCRRFNLLLQFITTFTALLFLVLHPEILFLCKQFILFFAFTLVPFLCWAFTISLVVLLSLILVSVNKMHVARSLKQQRVLSVLFLILFVCFYRSNGNQTVYLYWHQVVWFCLHPLQTIISLFLRNNLVQYLVLPIGYGYLILLLFLTSVEHIRFTQSIYGQPKSIPSPS